MVWVRKDFQRPSSPTPCNDQEHLELDQVALSIEGIYILWGISALL